MFLKGNQYKNRKGQVFQVELHLADGAQPVLAKNVKTGLLEKFCRNGHYYSPTRVSDLDLIDEVINVK